MINVAICDDEEVYTEAVYEMLDNCAKFMNIKISLDVYNSSTELLGVIRDNPLKYSILFVDILMPELTGVDLSKEVKKLNKNMDIIFVTSTSEYVFDAYDMGALNYILKPIEKNRLEEQFLRAVKAINKKRDTFIINKSSDIYLVDIDDIIYFEIRNRIITIEYVGGSLEFYETISEVEEKLAKYNFIKVHRSYLVNPEYIFKLSSSKIELKDGRWIPVSKLRFKSIKQEFMSYIETTR